MRKCAFRVIIRTVFIVLLTVLAGCASPFQGIKVRAQAPAMDEAFRKLTLAITTDGYSIASIDPLKHMLESGWKELTQKEKSDADRKTGEGKIEGKITLRMDARGKLYDVYMTPVLRYTVEGKEQQEVIAAVRHPLREKWEMAIMRLLEREAKEED